MRKIIEDAATLGESLALPPFLEPYRREIVANLQPMMLADFAAQMELISE